MIFGVLVVDWESGIIWLGIGEVNFSCFFYVGFGVFKSKDGGKSWFYFGLGESYYIGCIIIYL